MPNNFPRAEIDEICIGQPGLGVGFALREFTIPVSDELKPVRGVKVVVPGAARPDTCADERDPNVLGAIVPTLALFIVAVIPTDGGTKAPLAIPFELRAGLGSVVTTRITGTFTPTSYEFSDLFAQTGGLLASQYELWARIAPGAGAAPVRVLMTAALATCCSAGTVLGPATVA